jgi:hypothetical protein
MPKRNPARRNRASTKATLVVDHDLEAPPLPAPPAPFDEWHPRTVAWWVDLWASPMAPEYHESDVHGLYVLAALVNHFWHQPRQDLAAEIRLQRQSFGLTPLDRRRLQWEIERTDEAQAKGTQRRAKATEAKAPAAAADPRQALRSVS